MFTVVKSRVVKKYALALLNNTQILDNTNDILVELKRLNTHIQKSGSWQKILFSQYINQKTIFTLYSALLSKLKFSKLLKNFIMILGKRRRLYLLDKIIMYYEHLAANECGIVNLKIKLANRSNQSVITQIKKKISRSFRYKKIKFDFIYDQSMLDGILIEKDTQILDLSLASKLIKINSTLKNI